MTDLTVHVDRGHQANAPRQRGSTLVEALIAFLVLSFGMMAVARTQGPLRAEFEFAHQRADAMYLAQQQIELVRALRPPLVSETRTTTSAVAGMSYRVSCTLAAIDVPPASSSLRAVAVQVEWTDRRGAAQTLLLHTLVDNTDPALAGALSLASPSPATR